jgi:Fe-S-cluster containining protein
MRVSKPKSRDEVKSVWKGPSYECRLCGACCSNQQSIPAVGYVGLTKHESKQMKRLGLSVVQTDNKSLLGTRDRVGTTHPVCVALRGHVGGQCRCAIYELRPHKCRQFEVGSSLCQIAREEAGLPV